MHEVCGSGQSQTECHRCSIKLLSLSLSHTHTHVAPSLRGNTRPPCDKERETARAIKNEREVEPERIKKPKETRRRTLTSLLGPGDQFGIPKPRESARSCSAQKIEANTTTVSGPSKSPVRSLEVLGSQTERTGTFVHSRYAARSSVPWRWRAGSTLLPPAFLSH